MESGVGGAQPDPSPELRAARGATAFVKLMSKKFISTIIPIYNLRLITVATIKYQNNVTRVLLRKTKGVLERSRYLRFYTV